MRKLLLLSIILLLLPLQVHATWTLTQVKGAAGGNCTSPCTITVTSTGAGHLLVVGIIDNRTGITIASVSAGACVSTWTHVPNSTGSNTGDGSTDLYYCTNSASAQTTITITESSSSTTSCTPVIWEASSSLGGIALDSGANPSNTVTDSVNCTSCAGVALTLSGNNNFVVGIAACGQSCSNLTGTGWTNDLGNPQSDGIGHGITSGSQTAPTTWVQAPTGTLLASAAAFQEVGTVTCSNSITLTGVGCK